jgi:hypothetical protein
VAKDGADLPSALAVPGPAVFTIGVGETYDFQWTPPQPGDFTLHVVTTFPTGAPGFPVAAPPPDTMDILVRVRSP